MERLVIEWGNLERTQALEDLVHEKATKLLKFRPNATKLIVTFQIINPKSSSGPATQKVSMELRLPQNQDIRAAKEGTNAYNLINEAEKALLTQIQ